VGGGGGWWGGGLLGVLRDTVIGGVVKGGLYMGAKEERGRATYGHTARGKKGGGS